MPGEGYLPPVVVEVTGEDASFVATMARDKAILVDFARTVSNAQIGAESADLTTKVAAAKTELLRLSQYTYRAKLGAEIRPEFYSKLADLRTTVAAMSPMDVDIDVKISGLAMAMAEYKGAVDLMRASGIINRGLGLTTAGAAGGGGGGGLAAGGVAGAALLSQLGFGKGNLMAALTAPASIFSAGFGSVGALAGFGPEHALTTGIGLAGSAGGAALGGGLLAAGSLGVSAVGMGTDLAGIGQARGDIKTQVSDQNALNQAIAVYGANSTQAATAQAQMNYDLASFSPVARQAVVQTADLVQGFKTMFDQYTGQAEKTGAQIIGSLVTTAQAFLPEIGTAAARNMLIIQKAMGPLEDWLKSPSGGLGIFTQLEDQFTKQLPTAMSAFTNGLELLIRTIGFVAPYTGGLIADIARLTEKFNGAGWGKWTAEITKLIDIFRVWDAFVVILVKDIFDLFGLSAGLGVGIIQTLTGYLLQLHTALLSAGNGSNLSQLFQTHKDEIIALIKVLVELGRSFTNVYLLAAPDLVRIATVLLQITSAVLTLVASIPGGADLVGFLILYNRLQIVKTAMMAVKFLFTDLPMVVGELLGRLAALNGMLTATAVRMGLIDEATGAMTISMAALSAVGIIALAVGVYELIRYFGVLPGLMIAGAAAVGVLTIALWALDAVPVVLALSLIVIAVAGLVAGIIYLATHWNQDWPVMRDAIAVVLGPLALVAMAIDEVAKHFDTLKKDVIGIFKDAYTWLIKPGEDIVKGLVSGIISDALSPVTALEGIGKKMLGGFLGLMGIASDSKVMIQAGKDTMGGLTTGITMNSGAAVDAAKTVANQITAAFGATGVGPTATSVTQLKSVFTNLASMFTSLNTAANKGGNVSDDILKVQASLRVLAQDAPSLVKSIDSINKSFAGLSTSSGLKGVSSDITQLGTLFKNLGTLSQGSSAITVDSVKAITDALGILTAKAPEIAAGIWNVITAFSNMGKQAVVAQDLKSLSSIFGPLSKVFADFGTLAGNTGSITAQSILDIENALTNLDAAAPIIIGQIKILTDSFKNLKTGPLNTELDNLNTTLGKLGGVFTTLSNDAQGAAAVTPDNLGLITQAVKDLGGSMSSLPTEIGSLSIGTLSAFANLVAVSTDYLNTTGTTLFHSAGMNMMSGLALGISQGAGGVAAAVVAAVLGAAAASNAATITHSPSQLYAEQGRNWMLGIVQGIRGNAAQVQAALTGSLPSVGRPVGLTGGSSGLSGLTVHATFQINAPGGNPASIKSAIEKDSAEAFAKQALISLRAGAGTQY
jgi:hypothetical protein